MMDLAIILLNYNGTEDTIECIESLNECDAEFKYNIYIMDNASSIENFNNLKNYCTAKGNYTICSLETFGKGNIDGNFLISSEINLGFAGGNNKIIDAVFNSYKYVLLLNNDTVVCRMFLKNMIHLLQNDDSIGYASCRINNFYDRNLLWNCGGKLRPWGLRKYCSEKELRRMPAVIDAEFITGCALFIRSSVIEKYGRLTNDFFHGEEDFNFCWKMKKNHIKGKCLNETLVYHKVSATSKKAGIEPGKYAGYYAYRIVDMKQFYPKVLWHIWKIILIQILKIKLKLIGYSKAEIGKITDILKRASKLNTLNREDTFKIWDLTF